MDFRGFGRSETGEVRSVNEDSYWVDDELGVFVVADGMGGKSRGDRASELVVEGVAERAEQLYELLEEGDPGSDRRHRMRVHDFLNRLVAGINETVYVEGDGDMGSTCEIVVLSGSAGFVSHVGDSRTYLVRDGSIHQLTEDHTFAERLRREDRVESVGASALEHYEHVLTRSIGGEPEVDVDTLFVDVQAGDRFVLCSDGVSDVLEEEGLLGDDDDPSTSADRMVQRALEAGTTDNATSVVVAVHATESGGLARDTIVDTVRKVSFLEQIEVFRGLDERDLMKILRIVYRQKVDDGAAIIERSEDAEEMYMLLEGEVSLQIEGHEVARLEPGAHFGEMALFGANQRSADAIAVGEVVLLTVPSDQFRRLVHDEDVELGNKLLRSLLEQAAARIRETTLQLMKERNESDEQAELLGRARTLELQSVGEEQSD